MSAALVIIIAAIVALLALSAFFSGSETSLTAISLARLHELERRGDKRAAIVRQLIAMRDRLAATILLGSNFAKIAASVLATSVLVRLFGPAGVVYALLAMTVLVIFFVELLPRTYAAVNADRVALTAAPILRLLVILCGPIVIAAQYVAKYGLRLFGMKTGKVDHMLSAHEELRDTIALHHSAGSVVTKDRDMLGGILNLQNLTVIDVMVHRTKMVTVDRADAPAAIIGGVLKSGHTRLPVWKDSPENIIGVLHARDLLKEMQKHKGDATKIDLDEIISPPWFVPDTRPVADQLNAFLRRKTHSALVVDEYGEVMGLVTLEDIIEEIVGDIADEHDIVVPGVRAEPLGSYVVDGIVPVRDLNRLNDWDLPDEEVTTVAGLVIHEARMIPDPGQTFTFHGFRFEVLRKRGHQITSLRITPLKSRMPSTGPFPGPQVS
jgi:Mg2+/Co2+ transporter CorB